MAQPCSQALVPMRGLVGRRLVGRRLRGRRLHGRRLGGEFSGGKLGGDLSGGRLGGDLSGGRLGGDLSGGKLGGLPILAIFVLHNVLSAMSFFKSLIGPHWLGLPQTATSTVCQPMEQRCQGSGILLQQTLPNNLGPHTMVPAVRGQMML